MITTKSMMKVGGWIFVALMFLLCWAATFHLAAFFFWLADPDMVPLTGALRVIIAVSSLFATMAVMAIPFVKMRARRRLLDRHDGTSSSVEEAPRNLP